MFRKRPPSVAKSEEPVHAAEPSKRLFSRASVFVPSQYALIGRNGYRAGVIRDLSGGGVRLETEEDLQPGAILELRFSVGEGEQQRRARGRVVLSFFNASEKKFAHGIAFTGIEHGDREAIVRYITGVQRGDARKHAD